MTNAIFLAVAMSLITTAAHAHEPAVFSATLLGSNEVGNVFDPDGFGTATATIDPHSGQVDWAITFSNLWTVVAAHIHSGAAGVNGPMIINFAVPSGPSRSGSFSGSVVDPDALAISALNASDFYFNVHTTEFPGGAIRGQLAPVPEPASVALILAGLVAVGSTLRRRSR